MSKKTHWWSGMSAADISTNLYGVVKGRHPPPKWASFTELRGGTGSGGYREKFIDVLAILLWEVGTVQVIAYEIKASRADFLREIKDPPKRQYAERISTDAYFAAPSGLLAPSEVPEPWGLIEVQRGGRSVIRRACTQRKIEPWSWHQVQALARRVSENDEHETVHHNPYWYLSGRKLTRDELGQEISSMLRDAQERGHKAGVKDGVKKEMESYAYKEMQQAKQAIIDLCGYSSRFHLAQSLKDWAEAQKRPLPNELKRLLLDARNNINNILGEE